MVLNNYLMKDMNKGITKSHANAIVMSCDVAISSAVYVNIYESIYNAQ